MSAAGGGPNWFTKSAVASTSSNVTPFLAAVGRAPPPPPLLFPLDSPPRKLLNMFKVSASTRTPPTEPLDLRYPNRSMGCLRSGSRSGPMMTQPTQREEQ
jgi:hypothetical protein